MIQQNCLTSIPEKRSTPKARLRGLILLIMITVFWGVAWPIMRYVLEEIPPLTFRTYCVAFGGFALLALARLKGEKLRIPRYEWKPLLVASFFNVTGWHVCSAYGIILLGAGRSAIVAYTMPVWAVLLSALILKERITLGIIVSLTLGMIGLGILIGPGFETFGAAPLGALLMLAAAIFWGAGTVAVKYTDWTMSTALITGWQMVIGGIPVVIGALIFEPGLSLNHVSLGTILAFLYILIIPVTFCQWAWFKIIDIFPATIAAIGTLATPVIGVLSGALILGEQISIQEVAALLLILCALMLVLIKSSCE
jgi:drug/metabolite transporter (DMT)-like permease